MNRHFFIVGAQRSGTTYLYTVLDEHPEIEMARPLVPEPKFFLRTDLQTSRPREYEEQFFGRKPGAKRYGEKSTSYIEYEAAARRIACWYPDTQLIFLLRNPVTRAISNYQLSKRNGLETLPIAQAFSEEALRRDAYNHRRLSVSPFAYLQRGHYIKYLLAYEKIFDRRQMIVLIYEECVGQLANVQALYETLGVEKSFVPPSLSKRVNSGKTDDGTAPPELRLHLTDYFSESVAALEAYIGRTVIGWRH